MNGPDEGREARCYLRARRAGVLATISVKLGGWPFASVVPFVPDHAGQPVMLVSRLAEHTRNMANDPRVSLLVQEPAVDVQAGSRLTLAGRAETADDAGVAARHLRYLPDAARLLDLGDFSFYRIVPTAIRFIGGFGRILWISAERYAVPDHRMAEAEAEIVAHMNADHADALRAYCRHVHGRSTTEVEMTGIDCDGFDVCADGMPLRIDFRVPVTSAAEARAALVALAARAREP